MRIAVIVFPGSNCDRDVTVCLEAAAGAPPARIWHTETALPPCDALVLPGGFSYGDHLRGGAMAANSPIMPAIIAEAKRGTPVLGICNGFQILTECGLLPGALMRNRGLTFVCRNTRLKVGGKPTPFTQAYEAGETITLPVAHNEGNYVADADTLARLHDEDRIILTYAEGDNPNGAQDDIAGIADATGNVVGMMPHPERRAEPALGGEDGKRIFTGLMDALAG